MDGGGSVRDLCDMLDELAGGTVECDAACAAEVRVRLALAIPNDLDLGF